MVFERRWTRNQNKTPKTQRSFYYVSLECTVWVPHVECFQQEYVLVLLFVLSIWSWQLKYDLLRQSDPPMCSWTAATAMDVVLLLTQKSYHVSHLDMPSTVPKWKDTYHHWNLWGFRPYGKLMFQTRKHSTRWWIHVVGAWLEIRSLVPWRKQFCLPSLLRQQLGLT